MKKVLLVGESWTTITTHQKGFDSFSTVDYEESAKEFKWALEGREWVVSHLPAHRIEADFPTAIAGLDEFDVVVISDVGSNTFLLPHRVFIDSRVEVDRLAVLADYVRGGGGLVMVGGYMSFSGIEGKARYGRTPIAKVLPVRVDDVDDRVECPAGASVDVSAGSPIDLRDLGEWPALLGYNSTTAKPEADVVVTVDNAPLVATMKCGAGRSAVFTSDLAPHWVTPEFVAWNGYAELWDRLLTWTASR